MLPPRLSRRSRRKAGEKAVIARQERASVKEQVALGEIYFFDLFKDERKAIARMKLIDLLQSVPGIGQSRADVILKRTGISPSRRIGGVGHRQLELLRQEFLLIKNSRKSGKLLVVSGPSGVGKSTITNKLRIWRLKEAVIKGLLFLILFIFLHYYFQFFPNYMAQQMLIIGWYLFLTLSVFLTLISIISII